MNPLPDASDMLIRGVKQMEKEKEERQEREEKEEKQENKEEEEKENEEEKEEGEEERLSKPKMLLEENEKMNIPQSGVTEIETEKTAKDNANENRGR